MADPIRLYSIKNFGNEIANVIIDEPGEIREVFIVCGFSKNGSSTKFE